MSCAARHHSVLVLFSVSDSATNAPMMRDDFTHEVWTDAAPRRRVRISGPLYGDDNVPLLRVEFEGGDSELMPTSEMRLFHPLQQHAPTSRSGSMVLPRRRPMRSRR